MWLKCSLCSKNCFFYFLLSAIFFELPITRTFFRFPLKVRVIGSRLYRNRSKWVIFWTAEKRYGSGNDPHSWINNLSGWKRTWRLSRLDRKSNHDLCDDGEPRSIQPTGEWAFVSSYSTRWCSLVPRPVCAIWVTRGREFSLQAWQVTSHPKSPRTTGNEAAVGENDMKWLIFWTADKDIKIGLIRFHG